jgi:hypothetical protein
MSTTLSYQVDFHIERRGHGARRVIDPGLTPVRPDPGRVPRLARLMALALRFDEYLRTDQVAGHAALAEIGHVSRARISQIMNLLNLAPDIQEAILLLPRTLHGRDAIHLRQLQPIASTFDWRKQRAAWQRLKVQMSQD